MKKIMKAQDLRLGNLAQDQNGNLLKVISLDENKVEYKVEYSVVDRSKFPLPDGWQAQGIEINGFWLSGFGFEVQSTSLIRDKYEYRFDYKIGFQFGFKEGYSTGFLYMGDVVSNVVYVHQLQNLFFACTGKELDFKIGN